MSSFFWGSKLRARLRRFFNWTRNLFLFLIFALGSRAFRRSYITCSRDDGGGAQIHGRLSVRAFCDFFGFRFINTKILGAHFSDGESWDLQWNSLFDFGIDISSLSDEVIEVKSFSCSELSIKMIKIFFMGKFRKPYLFQMESAHQWTDQNPKVLGSRREEFRNIFVPVQFNGNEEIVVHLRRGNDLTAKIRVESDAILYLRLRNLMKIYPSKRIRIYTNVPFVLPDEFHDYVVVDFGSNPFQAISHMAEAEILIIAKSSMSYVAALVSHGQVFAPNFWHPLMSDWKRVIELEKPFIVENEN